jgi:proteic killer suppression protein
MIKSFRSKGLAEIWSGRRSAKIDARLHDRIRERLDALDAAEAPEELSLPGFDFHALRGKPKRYTIHVNGPWCITFEFEGNSAHRVDFEQYH